MDTFITVLSVVAAVISTVAVFICANLAQAYKVLSARSNRHMDLIAEMIEVQGDIIDLQATMSKSLVELNEASAKGATTDIDELTKDMPPDLPRHLREIVAAARKAGGNVLVEKAPRNEQGECLCPDCVQERRDAGAGQTEGGLH